MEWDSERDADAALSTGRRQFEEGDMATALETFKAVAKWWDQHNSDNVVQRLDRLARSHGNAAGAAMQMREWEDVVAHASACLRSHPSKNLELKSLIRRGLARVELEDWEGAVADFEEALGDDKLPPSLASVARPAWSRARKMCRELEQSTIPSANELLHEGHSLRLNLRAPLPAEIATDTWTAVHVFVANEFGLFRRSNIPTDDWSLGVRVRWRGEEPSWSSSITMRAAAAEGPGEEPQVDKRGHCRAVFQVSMELSSPHDGPSPEAPLLEFFVVSHTESNARVVPVLSTPVALVHYASNSLVTRPSSPPTLETACWKGTTFPGGWFGYACRTVAPHSPRMKPVWILEARGDLGIGGSLWDAGHKLAQLLVSDTHMPGLPRLEGRVCLELGSGTGVVGLAAWRAGAKRVILSDMPEVCPLLRQSVALNAADPEKEVGVCAIAWGDTAALRESWPDEPVDWILLADVVYDPEGYAPLLASLGDAMEIARRRGDPLPRLLLAYRARHPESYQFFAEFQKRFSSQLAVGPDAAGLVRSPPGTAAGGEDGVGSDIAVYICEERKE